VRTSKHLSPQSKNQTADPAAINWAARVAKRRNDAFVSLCLGPLLHSAETDFNVLSLPAADWLWERQLAEQWDSKFFRFQGVEKQPDIREAAETKATYLNSEPSVNAFYDILPEPSLKSALLKAERCFDIIYADYMGAWGVDKFDDVEVIFGQKLLNPFGCLVMTLSLVRNASPLFSELQDYARGDFEIAVIDDREHCRTMGFLPDSSVTSMSRGIPRAVIEQAAAAGVRLKLIMGHIYYNVYEHQGGIRLAPEISLCFRHEI
jgi:hypothetical protein